MKQLPSSTVRLITSSQVITSVYSVVKELIENSIDADSTVIDIKLENYGFDKIEIRDNGKGIKADDTQYMGQPHYTSKISSFDDLSSLPTYGFRGEALGSLCAVSSVSITTMTSEDNNSTTYNLDNNGQVLDKKPSHLGQGTSVVATNLFKNVPVRRQYYNSVTKKKDSLKQVEDLVMSYSIICHNIRFTLRHNKDLVWQSNPVSSEKSVLLKLLGSTVMVSLQYEEIYNHTSHVGVKLYLPKRTAAVHSVTRSSSDRLFVYVNKRPVQLKDVEKVIRRYYNQAMNTDSKWPVGLVSLSVGQDKLDVNIDPNKNRVMMHNTEDVLAEMKIILERLYGKLEPKENSENKPPSDQKRVTIEEPPASCSNHTSNSTANIKQQNTKTESINGNIENKGTERLTDLNINELPHRTANTKVNGPKDSAFSLNNHAPSLHVTQTTSLTPDIQTPNATPVPVHSSTQSAPNQTLPNDFAKANLNLMVDFLDSSQDIVKQLGVKSLETDARSDTVFCDATEQNLDSDPFACLNTNKTVHFEKSVPQGGFIPDVTLDQNARSRASASVTGTTPTAAQGISTESWRVSASALKVQHDSVPSASTLPGISSLFADETVGVSPSIGTVVTDKKAPDVVIDVSEWSKGNVVLNDKPLEGAKLLAPSTTKPHHQDTDKPTLKNTPNLSLNRSKNFTDSPGQLKLYNCMKQADSPRPTQAYIHFSKLTRQQLIENNPNISFKEIADCINRKWKGLGEEREEFGKKAAIEQQRLKEQSREHPNASKLHSVWSANKKQKLNESNQNKKKLSSQQKPLKPACMKTVQFSTAALKHELKQPLRIYSPPTTAAFLGTLKPYPVWIYLVDNHVRAFHPIRAQEMLIYHGLLGNHVMSTEDLEKPIQLSAQIIGNNTLWSELLKVEKGRDDPTDPRVYYHDNRLVYNGFKIAQIWDESIQDLRIEIVGMCKNINFYGLKDLREILSSMCSTDTQAVFRPSSVRHYLQAEAVRMSRHLPTRWSREEVEELYEETTSELSPGCSTCFHNKAFTWSLYDMALLPQSQDSYMSTQCTQDTVSQTQCCYKP